MPRSFSPFVNTYVPSFGTIFQPVIDAMTKMPPLGSRGNRPLKMSFEDHLKALVFFHLEEHKSAQHLLQALEEDDFARNEIAPKNGSCAFKFKMSCEVLLSIQKACKISKSKMISTHMQKLNRKLLKLSG